MPNEPDNRFKTALDSLPDAPPPGTAFDADALWAEMDRQLRPRRRLRTAWLAAACGLLTLLAGVGGWMLFSEKENPAAPVGQLAAGNVRPETERAKTPPVADVPEVAKRPERRVLSPKPHVAPNPTARLEPAPVAESVPVAAVPETAPTEPEVSPQPIAEALAAVAKPGLSEKKTARSKPRFRVVHANELPSNETIPTKQPRTEATARVTLGFPSALQPASAETPHLLILTKKPD